MTETVTARILRLPHAEDLLLPAYETEGSAGMDRGPPCRRTSP